MLATASCGSYGWNLTNVGTNAFLLMNIWSSSLLNPEKNTQKKPIYTHRHTQNELLTFYYDLNQRAKLLGFGKSPTMPLLTKPNLLSSVHVLHPVWPLWTAETCIVSRCTPRSLYHPLQAGSWQTGQSSYSTSWRNLYTHPACAERNSPPLHCSPATHLKMQSVSSMHLQDVWQYSMESGYSHVWLTLSCNRRDREENDDDMLAGGRPPCSVDLGVPAWEDGEARPSVLSAASL